MRARGVAYGEYISPEFLPDQDADDVFANYRIDRGTADGPAFNLDGLEGVFPGWCEQLAACRDGRVVLAPRKHAFTVSFRTLEMTVHYIVSHIAGPPGIAAPGCQPGEAPKHPETLHAPDRHLPSDPRSRAAHAARERCGRRAHGGRGCGDRGHVPRRPGARSADGRRRGGSRRFRSVPDASPSRFSRFSASSLRGPGLRPRFAGARWRRHILRSRFRWSGATAMFAAVARMPMADATAISFLSPLVAMALASPFFGEHSGPRELVAAGPAITGALQILRPGSEAFQPASPMALAAAAFMGVETIFIQRLSDTNRPGAACASPTPSAPCCR